MAPRPHTEVGEELLVVQLLVWLEVKPPEELGETLPVRFPEERLGQGVADVREARVLPRRAPTAPSMETFVEPARVQPPKERERLRVARCRSGTFETDQLAEPHVV